MAYEHDHGLALTGEASEAAPEAHSVRRRRRPRARRHGEGKIVHAEQVIRVRAEGAGSARLSALPASTAGLGEDTVKAIRDFEMDKGLVPKGRISAELVARLSEAQASPRRVRGMR